MCSDSVVERSPNRHTSFLPSLIAGFVIITPEYLMTVLLLSLVMLQTSASTLNESLWEAARAGDIARIAAMIDQGADVNASAPYGMTALHFAAVRWVGDCAHTRLRVRDRAVEAPGAPTRKRIGELTRSP